jgi:hypothetical protein
MLGEVQFPCPLHTVLSLLFFPKHTLSWHMFPVFPVVQVQTFVAVQFPNPEQTVGCDPDIPKHVGI